MELVVEAVEKQAIRELNATWIEAVNAGDPSMARGGGDKSAERQNNGLTTCHPYQYAARSHDDPSDWPQLVIRHF